MNVRPLVTVIVGALALIAVPNAGHAARSAEPAPGPALTALSPETDATLWTLAGTQSDAEIEAVVESGLPVADLFDPVTNDVLAAVNTAPQSSLVSLTRP